MSSRALVILFRYKLLLLLPFLITVPAAVAYVLLTGDTAYQAQAQVDVSRPSILDDPQAANRNPYLSPAANEAGFVREALRTNDFTDKVAQRASEGGEPVTRDEVRNGAWAVDNGTTLLTIGFTGDDAETAARVVDAIVEQYALLVRERTLDELEQVEGIYQLQADDALADANAAREELAEVVADLPPDANLDLVPSVTRLRSQADSFQEVYNDALEKLSAAQQFVRQINADGNLGFQVIDAAETPSAPLARPKMELFGPPALAVLLSLAISAGVFALLFKTDSTLRTLDDFDALPGVRWVGTVPDQSPAGVSSITQLAKHFTSGGRGIRPASGSGG